jgi:hypothetical protein
MVAVDLVAHDQFSHYDLSDLGDQEWDFDYPCHGRVGHLDSGTSSSDGDFDALQEVEDFAKLELAQHAR